jgi:hypothetical protein
LCTPGASICLAVRRCHHNLTSCIKLSCF